MRKSAEEAARRLRSRTASFAGAGAVGVLADAARALQVDASADERQIRLRTGNSDIISCMRPSMKLIK